MKRGDIFHSVELNCLPDMVLGVFSETVRTAFVTKHGMVFFLDYSVHDRPDFSEDLYDQSGVKYEEG